MKLTELNAVRSLRMRYEAHEILLRRTNKALASMTSVLTGMPKAQALAAKVESLTLRKLHLEAELARLRDQIEAAAINLATSICQEFDDETAQVLLLLRYVECLSWTKVAERMNYDRRYVFKLHKKTLASTT